MKDKWLNIYDYNKCYVWGSALYSTPTEAVVDLADKEHYLHTINVENGKIVKMRCCDKKECE
jgi:hypothetical protein